MVKLRRAAAPDLPDASSSEEEDTCSDDGDSGSWCSSEQESSSDLSDIEELSEEGDQDTDEQAAEKHVGQETKGEREQASANSAASGALPVSLCGWFADGTGTVAGNCAHDDENPAGSSSTPVPDVLLPDQRITAHMPSTAAAAAAATEPEQDAPDDLGISFNPFAALDGVWSDSDSSEEHGAQQQEEEEEEEDCQQQQQQQDEHEHESPEEGSGNETSDSAGSPSVSLPPAQGQAFTRTSPTAGAPVFAAGSAQLTPAPWRLRPNERRRQQLLRQQQQRERQQRQQHRQPRQQQRAPNNNEPAVNTSQQQQPASTGHVRSAPVGLAGSQLAPYTSSHPRAADDAPAAMAFAVHTVNMAMDAASGQAAAAGVMPRTAASAHGSSSSSTGAEAGAASAQQSVRGQLAAPLLPAAPAPAAAPRRLSLAHDLSTSEQLLLSLERCRAAAQEALDARRILSHTPFDSPAYPSAHAATQAALRAAAAAAQQLVAASQPGSPPADTPALPTEQVSASPTAGLAALPAFQAFANQLEDSPASPIHQASESMWLQPPAQQRMDASAGLWISSGPPRDPRRAAIGAPTVLQPSAQQQQRMTAPTDPRSNSSSSSSSSSTRALAQRDLHSSSGQPPLPHSLSYGSLPSLEDADSDSEFAESERSSARHEGAGGAQPAATAVARSGSTDSLPSLADSMDSLPSLADSDSLADPDSEHESEDSDFPTLLEAAESDSGSDSDSVEYVEDHDGLRAAQRGRVELEAGHADAYVDVQRLQPGMAQQVAQAVAVQLAVQQHQTRQPVLQLRNGMGLGLRSMAAFGPAQAEAAAEADAADVDEEDADCNAEHECWICFNGGPGLFSPCTTCSGSLHHIHRACFGRWLSTSWGMSCPNCARRYAPQVLSQFEDGRLLLALLEQQREQARARNSSSSSSGSGSSAASGGSSSTNDTGEQEGDAWQPDAPYPPYSVAHFTIGALQVCISAENQTPAALLRSIRSVVDSVAADPPFLADGTRMTLTSTQLGGLLIEQQQPPAHRSHGNGHSWFHDDEESDDDVSDEYEESDDDDDGADDPGWLAQYRRAASLAGQRPGGHYLRRDPSNGAGAGVRPTLGSDILDLQSGYQAIMLGEPPNHVPFMYHGDAFAALGARQEQQPQQRGNRAAGGGGSRGAVRGEAVRELRRSVAMRRQQHDRHANLGRRQGAVGRAMARGQRNR